VIIESIDKVHPTPNGSIRGKEVVNESTCTRNGVTEVGHHSSSSPPLSSLTLGIGRVCEKFLTQAGF